MLFEKCLDRGRRPLLPRRRVLARFGLGQRGLDDGFLPIDFGLGPRTFLDSGVGSQVGQLRFGFGRLPFVVFLGLVRKAPLAGLVALARGVGLGL